MSGGSLLDALGYVLGSLALTVAAPRRQEPPPAPSAEQCPAASTHSTLEQAMERARLAREQGGHPTISAGRRGWWVELC